MSLKLGTKNFTKLDYFVWIAGFFIFFLICKKAFTIPITHDEVGTVNYFSKMSIWDIITYKDPIPNNHILNTLLIKLFATIGGYSTSVVRLPSILSFIIYYYFVVKLIRTYFSDSILIICSIFLFVFNNYFIDFFSLARGYALSISFQMASVYYFLCFIDKQNKKDLILSLSLGSLAVYTNFTTLNFFLPLILLLFIFIITKKNKNGLIDKSHIFYLFLIPIICFLIIAYPISRMMKSDQINVWGSTGFYNETIKVLINNMKLNVQYFEFSNDTLPIIVVSIILFILSLYFIINNKFSKVVVYSYLLFFSAIIYNILQNNFLDVPNLNARTSLFYFPLLMVPFVFSLQKLVNVNNLLGLFVCAFLGFMTLQHFVRSSYGKSSYEWYYDENTYDVLKTLKEVYISEGRKEPIKLDCEWIFHPSLSFYTADEYNKYINLEHYHSDLNPNSNNEFYYIQNEVYDKMKDNFVIFKEFAWGTRKLVKRK